MLWFHLILLATHVTVSVQIHPYLDLEEDTPSFGVPTLLLDSLQLTLSSKLLLDIYSPQSSNLKGYLGWLPRRSSSNYTSCSAEQSMAESICLKYDQDMRLLVTRDGGGYCDLESLACDAVTCHKIHWTNHVGGTMDCFVLGEDEWYGGGTTLDQRWPVQEQSRGWHPAVTGDPAHHPHGNVVQNVWFSSGGFAIHVEDGAPLFVSFNESGSGKLCLSTSTKAHPYRWDSPGELEYTVCSAPDVKEAAMFALRKWGRKPEGVPGEKGFQYPVWSTWARYKADIDQEKALEFAHQIKLANFPTNQLEIDDKWEGCYGDLEFDPDRFPDPKSMVGELRGVGFAATLWVHPFCNAECGCFEKGKEFWVKDKKGGPLEVKWWNGDSAVMLDVTNDKAVEWFEKKLRSLQSKYGVASFKFDAGEALWAGPGFVFHDPEANLQPNLYSRRFAELAARFGGKVEVRTGFGTQHLPVFTRLFDKSSSWGYDNGLRTLIPSVLQMSMMGYLFILPDMVGGNNYQSDVLGGNSYSSSSKPDRYHSSLQPDLLGDDYQSSHIRRNDLERDIGGGNNHPSPAIVGGNVYYYQPNTVGGNDYPFHPDTEGHHSKPALNVKGDNNRLPDRELYVRWLEATAFLPSLQLSIPPWDYDDEVVSVAKRMVDFHDKYSVLVLDLARKALATGEPIVRPLWWVAPDDVEALRCDSQFLIGDNMLVAPVLEKGRTSREIYLPEGKWADVQRGKAYEGPRWLYNYSAPLSFLPFFIRHY